MRSTVVTLVALAAILLAGIVTAIVLARIMQTREAPGPWQPVSDARLLRAANDDGWLMFRRSYDSRGFAPFAQINRGNVMQLRPVFTHDTGLRPGHEAPPIVNGRYMIIALPLDRVIALDAVTGRPLWTFDPELPKTALLNLCCEPVSRGVAVYDRFAYLATLDDRVIALEAQSGRVAWAARLAPPGIGYSLTGAPLIVRGKVVIGTAGGEFPVRGFIAALDARNGRLVWKRYTVPRYGGSAWLSGSYDPETQTLFWGVGNPAPWKDGARGGMHLYTDSVLALDPDTGRIKWYHQFTPHDIWDYDGVNEDVLVDIVYHGRRVRGLYHPDRNGFFFVLDRTNGRLLFATPYVRTAWSALPRPGRPVFTCPATQGAKNWPPSSYDPHTGYAYFTTLHACSILRYVAPKSASPYRYLGIAPETVAEPNARGYGELVAVNVASGKRVWSHWTSGPWYDATLATGGGLVFTGTADGRFMAFDARTGRILWTYRTTSGIVGVPISYVAGGKQYVAVLAGWGGLGVPYGPLARLLATYPRGGRLYVFALP